MIRFEYCCAMVNINNNNKLVEKFKNTLLKCVDECLTNNTRNYFYFKEYLSFSHVWYCKYHNNNALYDKLKRDIVNEAGIEQKEFLWQSVKNEENNYSRGCNELCNFDIECESKSVDTILPHSIIIIIIIDIISPKSQVIWY